jgi:transaldolase
VIKLLTSKGISTNNTLTFVLPQLMACAKAVKEGLEIAKRNGVDLTRWRSVITHMAARYGDLGDLRKESESLKIDLSEADTLGQNWLSSKRPIAW